MLVLKEYFASNEDIVAAFVFGSFGTTSYISSRSDLDLAILYSGDLSLLEDMKISADLSVLLAREDVDIVNLNKVRVDLCHEILRTGEIVYQRDRIRTADFIEQTLKHYFDYGIPLERMRMDFLESLKGESGTHAG